MSLPHCPSSGALVYRSTQHCKAYCRQTCRSKEATQLCECNSQVKRKWRLEAQTIVCRKSTVTTSVPRKFAIFKVSSMNVKLKKQSNTLKRERFLPTTQIQAPLMQPVACMLATAARKLGTGSTLGAAFLVLLDFGRALEQTQQQATSRSHDSQVVSFDGIPNLAHLQRGSQTSSLFP